MNHLISTKQLKYSVAAFIISSSLIIKSLYMYTKNQSWLVIVIATTVSYMIVSIYARLARNYSGLNLIEINKATFGNILGILFSALYIFYFMTLTILSMRELGAFVKSVLLPDTPKTMIYIMFLFVCAYAVRKGAHTLTRYGTLATIIVITALLLNGALLLNKVHLDNFLPVFTVSIRNYLIGAHIVVMLPFGEVLAYIMFTPNMQKPGEFGKALRGGLAIGAVTILFIIVRDIAVLGKYMSVSYMPTFSSMRLIDIGDIFTRVEIVYAAILMALLFLKVSILYYATVTGISWLLKIDQYKILIFIVGSLVIVSANAFFVSSYEQELWYNVAPTFATLFLFVLPVLTLVVSEIGNSRRKNSADTSKT